MRQDIAVTDRRALALANTIVMFSAGAARGRREAAASLQAAVSPLRMMSGSGGRHRKER